MIKQNVCLDQIQYYKTTGVILHPIVYDMYTKQLLELARKEKCSLLPQTILELYCVKYQYLIAA